MIAAIQIQSMNYEDENFTPVFTRAKQEMFLELSEEAKSSLNRVNQLISSIKLQMFQIMLISIILAKGIILSGENGQLKSLV